MKNLLLTFILFSTNIVWGQQDSSDGFNYNHKLNRLFSIQRGEVLSSMDLSVKLGGAFGFEGKTGFLGTVAFGIGDFSEIEVGTSGLLSAVFDNDNTFGNVSMKFQILKSDNSVVDLSVGLRTNSTWESSSTSSDDIKTHAINLFDNGLRSVQYDSRINTLYICTSYPYKSAGIFTAGIKFSDLRLKNVNNIYNYGNSTFVQLKQTKKNLFGWYVGYERILSKQNTLILEIQSQPMLSVDPNSGNFTTENVTIGMMGVRFFVNQWLILDSGIRYQSNYEGLADARIEIGFTGLWSLMKKLN